MTPDRSVSANPWTPAFAGAVGEKGLKALDPHPRLRLAAIRIHHRQAEEAGAAGRQIGGSSGSLAARGWPSTYQDRPSPWAASARPRDDGPRPSTCTAAPSGGKISRGPSPAGCSACRAAGASRGAMGWGAETGASIASAASNSSGRAASRPVRPAAGAAVGPAGPGHDGVAADHARRHRVAEAVGGAGLERHARTVAGQGRGRAAARRRRLAQDVEHLAGRLGAHQPHAGLARPLAGLGLGEGQRLGDAAVAQGGVEHREVAQAHALAAQGQRQAGLARGGPRAHHPHPGGLEARLERPGAEPGQHRHRRHVQGVGQGLGRRDLAWNTRSKSSGW